MKNVAVSDMTVEVTSTCRGKYTFVSRPVFAVYADIACWMPDEMNVHGMMPQAMNSA